MENLQNLETIKKDLNEAFETYKAGLEGVKEYKKEFKNECKENLEWASLHQEEKKLKNQKKVLQEALTKIKEDKKALELTFETYQTLFDFANKTQDIFDEEKEKLLSKAHNIIKDTGIGQAILEEKGGKLVLKLI